MKNVNRWGLAIGLTAALALHGNARAQGAAGAAPSSGTGSATERERSTAGQPPSASGSRDPSATPGATGSSGARAGQKIDKDLQEKLEKIHAANQAEIHMAKMGQQRATSPQVKQFAEKLEQDHERLNEKLTQTAQSMGISLEGEEFQKAQRKSMKDMDKLAKKTGAEFDREFMEHMVDDHEKDVKAVRSAAEDAREDNHAELASLLEQAQMGMQGHLAQAQQIEKSLKEEERQRRAAQAGRPASTGTGAGGPGPTGSSERGAGGPGTGTGGPGSGANPTQPDKGTRQSR